jgi:hypothetical protein
MVRASGWSAGVVLAGLVTAGCGGGSSAIAGKWTKAMAGEGDVVLMIEKNGNASLALPDARWPAAIDLTGRVAVVGDSLSITADGGPSACPQPAPRYAFAVSGNTLTIGAGNTDPCGVRHAALVGTWTRS